MKKIPTMVERDWDGDRSRVLDRIVEGCEWVAEGEGRATQKLDGTCCMVGEDATLYRRHEVRPGKSAPEAFEQIQTDDETGKVIGWVPVGDGPEDRWHREALALAPALGPGTYELVGPKVQKNPERYDSHALVRHGDIDLGDVPRDYAGLASWLAANDVEGIVFHHPDGRMAKIKARDFGIRRGQT